MFPSRNRRVRRVGLGWVCAAALLLLAALAQGLWTHEAAAVTPTPTAMCDPIWDLVETSNIGWDDNSLRAVAGSSASNVWVAGYYEDYSSRSRKPLVMRWQGNGWNRVLTPDPGGIDSFFDGVDTLSATGAWTVGGIETGMNSYVPLVTRWNGTAWSNEFVQGVGLLHAVEAIASTNVWTVGQSNTDIAPSPVIFHWDGGAWSSSPLPPVPGGGRLFGVSAVSATDVWAVGQTGYPYNMPLVMRWNGTSWNIVDSTLPVASGQLTGVVALSGTDVWAVGGYYDGTMYRSLIIHWNGTTWSMANLPPSATNVLGGINAVSSTDIWAVGPFHSNEPAPIIAAPVVLHWNGSAWSAVSVPGAADVNFLNGVAAFGSSDVWAVGEYLDSLLDANTLALHYGTPALFTDVPLGSPFYPYVQNLACRGVISGYLDGTFKPNNPVTRGQLAKIASNSAGFDDPPAGQTFEDVPPGTSFYTFTERLASRDYIGGYDCGGAGEPCVPPGNRPYFRPNYLVTRGQVTKIVANSAGFDDTIPAGTQTFADIPEGSSFHLFVERLLLNRPGVMGGYPCGGVGEPCDPQQRPYFRPANGATRGQASKIIANTFFPEGAAQGGPRK